MTDMGTRTAGPHSSRLRKPPRLETIIAVGVVVGLVATGWTLFLTNAVEPRSWWDTSPQIVPLLIAVAVLGEVAFVPLRRGGGGEQLTFNGAVVTLGAMLAPPITVLLCSLAGLLIVDAILRREPIKIAFNLSAYASTAAVLLTIYTVLGGGADIFSVQAVLVLLLGSICYEVLNFFSLSLIWWSLEEASPAELWRAEWPVTVFTALSNVGLAGVALVLWRHAPTLVPFAALPAVALWYAFQAAASHTEAQERNRWLVLLGQRLAVPGESAEVVPEAADALRHVFSAELVRVVLNDGYVYASDATERRGGDVPAALSTDAVALRVSGNRAAELPPAATPAGWHRAVAVHLDLDTGGDGAEGVLLLGGHRAPDGLSRLLPWADKEWRLGEDDEPVFSALVQTLTSSLRVGRTLSALQEETEKLSAVVDNATDGIVVMSESREIVMWSPAMAAITSVPSEDVCGVADVPDFVSGLRDAVFADPAGAPDPGTVTDLQHTLLRPDGEERELDVSAVWIEDAAGAGRLVILTVRDSTRERRAERLKSDFIHTVSHELKTPITPIKGYAQILAKKGDQMTPEKRQRILGQIADRADHLSRLVEDLLLASRVSAASSGARMGIELGEVPAAELIEEALASYPRIKDRVTVTDHCEDAIVCCDRVRTVQCLTNLLGNAEKYSEEGTPILVEVTRDPRPADAPDGESDEGSDGAGSVVFSVTDQGRGIPADEIERVFERFYRVEDSLTMTTGGSGLGLFIARELARAMGGDIDATSRLGVGSTFRVRLPESDGRARTAGDAQSVRPGPSVHVPAGIPPEFMGQVPTPLPVADDARAGDDRPPPGFVVGGPPPGFVVGGPPPGPGAGTLAGTGEADGTGTAAQDSAGSSTSADPSGTGTGDVGEGPVRAGGENSGDPVRPTAAEDNPGQQDGA